MTRGMGFIDVDQEVRTQIVNTYTGCLLLYSESLIFDMENVPDGQGFVVTVGQRMLTDGLRGKRDRSEGI